MADLVYTIQPGDVIKGLLGIAERLYGDSRQWIGLYEANRLIIGINPNIIQPGQQLIVSLPAGDATVPQAVQVYIVQPFDLPDGLPGIARRVYGDADRWQELYRVNQGIIGNNPQRLQIGQRLIVW
jgi:nucleoid-associated protein YgaU